MKVGYCERAMGEGDRGEVKREWDDWSNCAGFVFIEVKKRAH